MTPPRVAWKALTGAQIKHYTHPLLVRESLNLVLVQFREQKQPAGSSKILFLVGVKYVENVDKGISYTYDLESTTVFEINGFNS